MTRTILGIALLAALTGCASVDPQRDGEPRMEPQANAMTFTMPSDQEIAVQRTFDAPRQRVWDAWTSCDHLPHWMVGPPGWSMAVCEIDLRPGGTQHLVWRDAEGAEIKIRGIFQEVRSPSRLVVREMWGGEWPETLNTLTLTEERGRTTMTMTIRYPSQEARDAALQTGMKDGMAHSFDGAARYLATMR